MEESEGLPKNPNLHLAELRYLLTTSDEVTPAKRKEEIKSELMSHIKKDNMTAFYGILCEQFKWTPDNALMQAMATANKSKMKEFDDKLKKAEDEEGESEVREALQLKAEHLSRIGSKDEAIEAFHVALEKTVGPGMKLDVIFNIIRVGFFHGDRAVIQDNIEWARELVEKEGDWERRNRLKVYDAFAALSVRNFARAAAGLRGALATFTCYELCSYAKFVWYTVVAAVKSLDRVTLKAGIINSPEVLGVIGSLPPLREYVSALYESRYDAFLTALAGVGDQVAADLYLGVHARYYAREMRIAAYAQFLESYRSVTLASMAAQFGVSVAWLDGELSRFIAAGRLNAKIDKVGGIVETNRPDQRNAQYTELLKSGDALLNRMQKLSRVINV